MVHSFEYCLKTNGETGLVEEVKEFLVKVSGLKNAVIGEGITFETEDHGIVTALGEDLVEVLVLSKNPLDPKTKAARTGTMLTISCGEGVLGKVLDAFGHSLTSKRHHSLDPEKRMIEASPAGISKRKKISRFFETGTAIVDLFVPIGAGQRELVIGDRKSGKTHFLLQTILSQYKQGTICIYAALGKKKTEVKLIEEFLTENKVLDKCVIVAADSEASPGEVYLAPYTAMTLAEYFRDQGRDVLLILDDLITHAKYYREIALLAGHFPGRESYPGDIFHVHSKLLERSGCFKFDGKSATITCLPVAESIDGDFTGYIQTNLMSMTDGHIYFDSELFLKGIRPAINIFLSVTRVGRQTQNTLRRDISNKILLALKKYSQAERFLRFGPEITDEIKNTLRIGNNLQGFFSQVGYWVLPTSLSVVLVSLLWQDFWDGKNGFEIAKTYNLNPDFQKLVEKITAKAQSLDELNTKVKEEKAKLLKFLTINAQHVDHEHQALNIS